MKIHMLWGDVFGEFILFIYHELTTAKFSVKKTQPKSVQKNQEETQGLSTGIDS